MDGSQRQFVVKATADLDQSGCGAWSPGISSRIPADLRHLCTLFRPECVFTAFAVALEISDLFGLEATEVVALRPARLALHELLVRVTAEFSVPDGERVEDLGINFRRMTRALLERYIEPQMPAITACHERVRSGCATMIARELERLAPLPAATAPMAALAAWETRSHAVGDPMEASVLRALARVVSALFIRHGSLWAGQQMIATVSAAIAVNELAGDAIGALMDPWLAAAAELEGYRLLPPQQRPVVMNLKGPSAAGKSTIRPLQKALAGRIGVTWGEFALISPDIWRKLLLDYATLGAAYKYGGAFTGDELRIVDQKLDRYMARKAQRGRMSHLLIDRFRFDSFAPDSNEAGSNLLTRFGQIVYLFCVITPPAALVERAWNRGLAVGRYKAVDDTLAHSVEAYSGIPQLFFTWVQRNDKQVHFEFLDNSVPQGEDPLTVAFGWNDVLNVLDIKCLLDVERFRKVNIGATTADGLFADPELLAAERNTGFLRACVRTFRHCNFADQRSGRVYLQLVCGSLSWLDPEALTQAISDADTRAGLHAVAPGALQLAANAPPVPSGPSGPATPSTPLPPIFLAREERLKTVGRWGLD
jgi:hypothetical protein